MKVLVTGGSGFVGANLCAALLNAGAEVICLDNFFSSGKENVADLIEHERFELVEGDIISFDLDTFGKVDEIYHLACPASPPHYQSDDIFTLRTCFEGTLNVLEFAKKVEAKVLFSSTSEVYGDPEMHPQKEDYRGNVNPHGVRSCYDEGKRVAESLCMNFHRKSGLDVKIVRIFNTYGPKMDRHDGRVVSNFIVQALAGEDLTVYGDGSQTRSFQYVDDLVAGMMAYMALEEDFPGPINLGNPNEFTVLELANLVRDLTSHSGNLQYLDLPKDDPVRRCPDIALAKKYLGWEPKIQLEEGLKKTIEYFRF